MSGYISVPGHASLRCCYQPSDRGAIHLWYTGDLDDLIASGLVTADMLEPKPRRSRQEMKEARLHVLNRNWRVRDGVPTRHYRLHFPAVPKQKAMDMPGAALAIRQHEWLRSELEREETVAPSAQQRVETQVQSILQRFMRTEQKRST